MDNTYQYIVANGGVNTASGYPYVGRVRRPHCDFIVVFRALTISSSGITAHV